MQFRFNKRYFIYFSILLIVEILIALLIKNPLIRGNVGDVLVVILIYCFIQAFSSIDKLTTIIGVGIFAVVVEISQAFHLLEKLNLENNQFLSIILGRTFDFDDLWAYMMGCVLIYILEFQGNNSRPKKRKLNF